MTGRHYIYIDFSGLATTASQIAGLHLNVSASAHTQSDYPWYLPIVPSMSALRDALQLPGLSADPDTRHCFGTIKPKISTYIEKCGFTVHPVGYYNRTQEKLVDTSIVSKMIEDAFTVIDPKTDLITLVAGDIDMLPAVDALKRHDHTVRLAFWGIPRDENGPQNNLSLPACTAKDLFARADFFLNLVDHLHPIVPDIRENRSR